MSDPGPALHVERIDAALVVTGEIDAHTAPLLAQQFVDAVDVSRLELHLAAIAFMDSSGLRVVLAEHERREAAGQQLVVVHPSASVIRLIELTGLVPYLHVEPALTTD